MTINLHLKKKYLREIDMYMSPRQAYDDEFLKELNWEMSIPSIFPINRNESGKWGKALGHRSNSLGDPTILSHQVSQHKKRCVHSRNAFNLRTKKAFNFKWVLTKLGVESQLSRLVETII